MRYVETTLVVEGALDETGTFFDYAILDLYERELEREAEATGAHMALYKLDHYHAPDVPECQCIQHATDLRPAREWNAPLPN